MARPDLSSSIAHSIVFLLTHCLPHLFLSLSLVSAKHDCTPLNRSPFGAVFFRSVLVYLADDLFSEKRINTV